MKAPSPFSVSVFPWIIPLPEHSAITDPNIHEPKDVSTAAAGEVYVADGAGSGAWGSVLPTQTSNSGKTLTTDGTTASWTANNRVLARGSVNVSRSSVSNAVNVASVSGSSTVTVTFSTPLSNTQYVALATVTSSGTYTDVLCYCTSKGTNSAVFRTYKASNGVATPISAFDFVIYG